MNPRDHSEVQVHPGTERTYGAGLPPDKVKACRKSKSDCLSVLQTSEHFPGVNIA